MPRYHFHLFNAVETQDPEGRIFPSLAAARTDAINAARALMAADIVALGEITLSHRIELEGDGGERLIVPFRSAVTIHP